MNVDEGMGRPVEAYEERISPVPSKPVNENLMAAARRLAAVWYSTPEFDLRDADIADATAKVREVKKEDGRIEFIFEIDEMPIAITVEGAFN